MEITLKIKLKDKEIELTEAEAKELYSFLSKTFGTPNYIPVPYPEPVLPPVYPSYPIITWGGGTGNPPDKLPVNTCKCEDH